MIGRRKEEEKMLLCCYDEVGDGEDDEFLCGGE